ncbi:hypothetical protein K443DRAFT_676955 [Laccaria amethystina LaAM-08-1]|uniref:Uncharacterized protein n=1 Tax=Laccaria amethystina LaAM-08-1 TaxID=1095629 RepID=A0A0C9XP46_9AGAR|nr:hypothetical protein K443DRAFT_676955 [Laccaria amethystina LaAM-08-1]
MRSNPTKKTRSTLSAQIEIQNQSQSTSKLPVRHPQIVLWLSLLAILRPIGRRVPVSANKQA